MSDLFVYETMFLLYHEKQRRGDASTNARKTSNQNPENVCLFIPFFAVLQLCGHFPIPYLTVHREYYRKEGVSM